MKKAKSKRTSEGAQRKKDLRAEDTTGRNEPQSVVPVTALPGAWQVVGAVVRGVSHERLGMPCQDAQDYRVLPGGTLLVALADGAGSASFSDQGARCAVNQALHSLAGMLEDGPPNDHAGWQDLLNDVFGSARAAVLELAQVNASEEAAPVNQAAPQAASTEPEEPAERQAPPERAYATTLTCVIAAPDRLVVGQIGDGVVVAGAGEELVTVTRLQRGEYANETHFLTQPDALEHLEVAVVAQPVSALAVMSDGLVRLALKMPEQEPHGPFFHPLFRVTAAVAKPGGELDETEAARQLSAFLGSERVNARTDDDKSLVLAVRAAAGTAALRESEDAAPPKERTMEEDASAGEGAFDSTRTSGQANRRGTESASPELDWERE